MFIEWRLGLFAVLVENFDTSRVIPGGQHIPPPEFSREVVVG